MRRAKFRCSLFAFLLVSLVIFIGTVEIILHFSQFVTKSVSQSFESKSKKFYIYDWPRELTDSTPTNFTHHRLSITPPFLLHSGVGKTINAVRGLYHTHQYSLFLLVYQKLLISKHRTLDPNEANLFFIPYDLGMDGSTRSSDAALFQTNCPRVSRVMELLRLSPHFKRNNGADHFLIHSINQMMVYYATPRCTRLYELCFNCTKLSIDKYSSELYPSLSNTPHMTHNWLSIPFPSNHHISSVSTHPWWRTSESQSWEEYIKLRPHALCFVGSLQVTARKQRELRSALMKECKLRGKEECLLVGLDSHESIVDSVITTSTASTKSTTVTSGILGTPYDVSRLCLMPGGDFPTRKGFLDAMLSGCVPVTFQLTSAQDQWPLHWITKDTAMRCTVYIPREDAMRDMHTTFERLLTLSADRAVMMDKLKCMKEVAQRFQYSLPVGAAGEGKEKEEEVDALSVVLTHLLNKR